MARQNYQQGRRQRELARKQKQDEKLQRRLERKNNPNREEGSTDELGEPVEAPANDDDSTSPEDVA